jgi:recombinational DNA repair ATPase RecF
MWDLRHELVRRADERGLSETTRRLAIAACDGETPLEEVLAGSRAVDGPVVDVEPPAARMLAELGSVRVSGFRGIGAEAVLELPRGPGLTLVVGANGSGKSSFAEAIEVALTGDNARWRGRSKVWREGWRNLHVPEPARVRVDVLVDVGTVQVERAWSSDGELETAALSVHGADGAPTSLGALGWEQGLGVYRPFLAYSELGAVLDDGPTALHDALSAVLGLDVLTAAAKRLRDTRLVRERQWKQVVEAGKAVAAQVETLDDDRARTAAAQLRTPEPSASVLRDLVTGTGTGVDRSLELLRQLVTVRGPDLDGARRRATDLLDAADALGDHAGSDAARDLEIADLLGAARRMHETHGDHACPVCRTGHLDAAWAGTARDREQGLRRSAAAVQRATARLESARTAVRQLVGPAPGIVERGGVAGVSTSDVMRAYEAWQAVAQEPDPRRQATALLAVAEELTTAVRVLREEADSLLRAREDAWRPLAAHVARWLEDAEAARERSLAVPELRAAERAVTAILEDIRRERWAPIAEQSRQIWAALRQRSNVSVEEVALAGSGVRRRVEVQVTVDGVAAAALGVMSQGELHALALSLFLPRATLPESPFRFVVLDDPVQAMDHERVDGLARVLDAVAMERQVVVFTHDDRLREALRRLGITATVLEVIRGRGSEVRIVGPHAA